MLKRPKAAILSALGDVRYDQGSYVVDKGSYTVGIGWRLCWVF